MFVEHQSTSGTKIHNPDACARAVLLNYTCTEITGGVVIIRFIFIENIAYPIYFRKRSVGCYLSFGQRSDKEARSRYLPMVVSKLCTIL